MIYLSYFLGNIVILRARLRGWPKTSAPFRLGRWGLVVNIVGLLYGGAMLINFAWPRPASNPKPNQTGGLLTLGFLNNVPILWTVAIFIVLLGAVYYAVAGRRKVMAPVVAPAPDDPIPAGRPGRPDQTRTGRTSIDTRGVCRRRGGEVLRDQEASPVARLRDKLIGACPGHQAPAVGVVRRAVGRPRWKPACRTPAPDRPRRPGTTVHAQIEDWLAGAIALGSCGPATGCRAEQDLAAWFGVSRMTLRHALGELAQRGLVTRTVGRGGGTFVAEPKLEQDLTTLAGFSEQLRRHGMVAGARVLSASQRPAGPAAAAALEPF